MKARSAEQEAQDAARNHAAARWAPDAPRKRAESEKDFLAGVAWLSSWQRSRSTEAPSESAALLMEVYGEMRRLTEALRDGEQICLGCKKKIQLAREGYRCLDCPFYFCRPCAEYHFNKTDVRPADRNGGPNG